MTDIEVGGIASDRLRSLIERIERLEEEKNAIMGDIRDIFAEAKSAGFDVKAMRAVLKLRKMNAADRDEQEFLLETYRKALDIQEVFMRSKRVKFTADIRNVELEVEAVVYDGEIDEFTVYVGNTIVTEVLDEDVVGELEDQAIYHASDEMEQLTRADDAWTERKEKDE